MSSVDVAEQSHGDSIVSRRRWAKGPAAICPWLPAPTSTPESNRNEQMQRSHTLNESLRSAVAGVGLIERLVVVPLSVASVVRHRSARSMEFWFVGAFAALIACFASVLAVDGIITLLVAVFVVKAAFVIVAVVVVVVVAVLGSSVAPGPHGVDVADGSPDGVHDAARRVFQIRVAGAFAPRASGFASKRRLVGTQRGTGKA